MNNYRHIWYSTVIYSTKIGVSCRGLKESMTHSTGSLAFEHNVGFALVQSDTHCVEFNFQKAPLFFGLGSIKHDKYKIGGFRGWPDVRYDPSG